MTRTEAKIVWLRKSRVRIVSISRVGNICSIDVDWDLNALKQNDRVRALVRDLLFDPSVKAGDYISLV